MYNFLPYMTNDYSVGLFNEDVDDIYHSAFGALSEAYEKFVNPLDIKKILANKKELRVLDICYGIGYNSKAFLNEFINQHKTLYKIDIDCVDTDEILMKVSPFIETEISFVKRFLYKRDLYKNIQNYEEAKKIVQDNLKKDEMRYKISECVNMIIIKNLIENYGDEFLDNEIEKILTNSSNKIFLNDFLVNFYKFYSKLGICSHQNKNKLAFLHNIYYENISKQYKVFNDIDHSNEINMKFYSEDVRNFIKNSDKTYDVIFLDGFTPSKCPCIWSVDFLKALYEHIDISGLLVTYNTSVVVRSALKQAGFYIGNTLMNGSHICGTIASKNPVKIKNKLNIKQIGLMDTKAGIPYRDNDLSQNNSEIISNRENEVSNSALETSSKYLKRINKKAS